MYIHNGETAREFVSIWVRDASRERAMSHIRVALAELQEEKGE